MSKKFKWISYVLIVVFSMQFISPFAYADEMISPGDEQGQVVEEMVSDPVEKGENSADRGDGFPYDSEEQNQSDEIMLSKKYCMALRGKSRSMSMKIRIAMQKF